MEYIGGLVLGLPLLAWAGWQIYQGYLNEQRPPLTLRDNGSGIMEPVCAHCQTRLVSVNRKTGSGAAGLFALLIGLVGIVVFLFHWLAGLVVIGLAVLINHAGKGQETVLTCPACGQEAKRLD